MSVYEFTTRPDLSGTFGAVASTHWIATAVGMRLLEGGGNAFDAATATAFVLQIVEPHLNGPAGDVPILVARRDDRRPSVICGQGPAPLSATSKAFRDLGLKLIPGTGLLAACVPGAFGAWLTLLRDWGSRSLREALEPAIYYAEEGHPLLPRVSDTIAAVAPLFREEWTASGEVYLPKGDVPTPGSIFRNERLAGLWRTILKHAEQTSQDRVQQIEAALSYWYEGPVAQTIDRFCQNSSALDVSGRRHSGFLRLADMSGWRPTIEDAVSVTYRGLEVFKCGAWSQGPAMLQALKILQHADVSSLDPLGAEYVHLVTEVMKLSMADRDTWYGDVPGVPLDALLSDDYSRDRRFLVNDVASRAFRPGSPGGRTPVIPPLHPFGLSARAAGGGEPTFNGDRTVRHRVNHQSEVGGRRILGDTCHIDAVDRWGNMVSATPSGGWLQSSPLIPELGFPLGTRTQIFWLDDGLAGSLRPGARPRTTLTPTMAFRDCKPYLAFGTPGGDQQEQWSLQLLLAHVDHGKSLQQAIDAPAFHTNDLISSFWPREISYGSLILESRFPRDTIADLTGKGHDVEVSGDWSQGRLSACAFEHVGGVPLVRAASNARGMQGYAIAR